MHSHLDVTYRQIGRVLDSENCDETCYCVVFYLFEQWGFEKFMIGFTGLLKLVMFLKI